MRRLAPAVVLGILLALLAACGGAEEQQALPETVVGTLEAPTDTGGGGENLPEGDPAAGKEIFTSAGCVSCHTLSDAGATGTVGPNLDESSITFEAAFETIKNGRGGMPPFGGQLDDQQIADVAAYVVQARG
jgi:mono/diheme cytochrome c family protein